MSDAGAPGLRRALRAARVALGWPARRLLDRRIEWIIGALDERFERFEERLGESLVGHRLASFRDTPELQLPADTARFLGWAESHEGPAARAGLWFNPPVALEFGEDAIDVLLVNERIVEQPYVFGALARLPRPARILDVGGAESTVALSLASLGHDVNVVDPRGYSLEHPGIHVHAVSMQELPREPRFDAAVALSSIEHFGLGAYGLPSTGDDRLDLAALSEIRERLVPNGTLVLTAPCASASSVDDFQRVYSIPELREMLRTWELVDLSVAWRRDRRTWVLGGPDEPGGEIGVAMATARRAEG